MRSKIVVLVAVCGFDIYSTGFAWSTLYQQATQRVGMKPPVPLDAVIPDPSMLDSYRGLYPPAVILGMIGLRLLGLAVIMSVSQFRSRHARPEAPWLSC